MNDQGRMTNEELAADLRQLAELAIGSEHRPPPCPICDLAKLAEQAADRLDQRSRLT